MFDLIRAKNMLVKMLPLMYHTIWVKPQENYLIKPKLSFSSQILTQSSMHYIIELEGSGQSLCFSFIGELTVVISTIYIFENGRILVLQITLESGILKSIKWSKVNTTTNIYTTNLQNCVNRAGSLDIYLCSCAARGEESKGIISTEHDSVDEVAGCIFHHVLSDLQLIATYLLDYVLS